MLIEHNNTAIIPRVILFLFIARTKIVQGESKTKGKLVFLFLAELPPILGEAKDEQGGEKIGRRLYIFGLIISSSLFAIPFYSQRNRRMASMASLRIATLRIHSKGKPIANTLYCSPR